MFGRNLAQSLLNKCLEGKLMSVSGSVRPLSLCSKCGVVAGISGQTVPHLMLWVFGWPVTLLLASPLHQGVMLWNWGGGSRIDGGHFLGSETSG